MRKLIEQVKLLINEGLFHVFGSGVLAQVGGLISSVIVIRRLPKVEYGYYVNATNIYSYLAIFIGLGLVSSTLQYCSEHISEERKNAIYKHSVVSGTLFNVILVFTILLLALLKRNAGDAEVARYIAMMCGLPLVVYGYNYFQTVLRVKLNNRAYAYNNMMFTCVTVSGNIILTFLLGIPGLILSTYLANGIVAVKAAMDLNKESFFGSLVHTSQTLTKHDRREITNYGIICTLTNFASTMLILLDVTCLDLVLHNPEIIADYKVAATIPAACSFIPGCLMTFFYPKIVDAFSKGTDTGRKLVHKLMKIFFAINFVVYLGLALFAPLIIWIIYGSKYMNIIPIFEVLSINYLFYSIRHVLGNVIAAIKRVKVNLVISVISGLANVGLNIVLIMNFASMGAAMATLLITVFVMALELIYLSVYFKKN